VTMLEGTISVDLQEFLTWLPLFLCSDKWSDRWCDAV
jgi:hypothetical protein